MPKQVDHDERREEIAAALWRVVRRDGIEGTSIRRVAAESGWSAGALRHYFATRSELLAFAMETIFGRVEKRISSLPRSRGRSAAIELLSEALPLDEERRAEMSVWLSFTAQSLTDPELRRLRDRAHNGLRDLCTDALALAGIEPTAARSERIHALLDGLALHSILAPEVTTPERQVEMLTAELDAMAAAG